MKRVDFVLSLVLAMSTVFVGSAQATLLDDYSTDQSSQYVSYTWCGSPAQAFARSSDMLIPTGVGNYIGTGFYWNGGAKLMPGDSISVEVTPDHSDSRGDDSFVGLCLATSTTEQNPYRVMGAYTDSKWQAIIEQAGGGTTVDLTNHMPDFKTPSLLTLARGMYGNQNVITWTFADIGGYGMSGTGTSTLAGVTASDALYFGTAGISAYTNNRPAWDNLTYSAVPEPGACVLLISSMMGLLAYAWRKRK
jgi:hypothetical protein